MKRKAKANIPTQERINHMRVRITLFRNRLEANRIYRPANVLDGLQIVEGESFAAFEQLVLTTANIDLMTPCS